MEKLPELNQAAAGNQEEVRIVDGKKYRKVDTGYTVRQYFSHSTPEKGPGPGWDVRVGVLGEMGLNPFDTPSLPNTPYYRWEEIQE